MGEHEDLEVIKQQNEEILKRLSNIEYLIKKISNQEQGMIVSVPKNTEKQKNLILKRRHGR